MKKAVFFDRDGTLNVDVHYLHRIEDFQWMPEAVEAIEYCHRQGYLVVVVTNQSGVARGYYEEADVMRLHKWMNEELAGGGPHPLTASITVRTISMLPCRSMRWTVTAASRSPA